MLFGNRGGGGCSNESCNFRLNDSNRCFSEFYVILSWPRIFISFNYANYSLLPRFNEISISEGLCDKSRWKTRTFIKMYNFLIVGLFKFFFFFFFKIWKTFYNRDTIFQVFFLSFNTRVKFRFSSFSFFFLIIVNIVSHQKRAITNNWI